MSTLQEVSFQTSSFKETPESAPLLMPVQNFESKPVKPGFKVQGLVLVSRLLTVLGTCGLVFWGSSYMLKAFEFRASGLLGLIFLALFVVLLAWISLPAVSSLLGFIFTPRSKHSEADSLPLHSSTVLLMPLYNEDAWQVSASLQAMAEDLHLAKASEYFEIFILSDTTNPEALQLEQLAVENLRNQLAHLMPVWYRHREQNLGRKAGNIADFVSRWGGRYEYMLVLDADSIMSAASLCALVKRMQADPKLGILQTIPRLCGKENVFARYQQFASRMYGKVCAQGTALWAGDEGNYWGHNALIRIGAFAQSCGLPELKGRKPFGGTILSHDFVEAALMVRSGWKVKLASDLEGSWEESPPSLQDVVQRDRRWAQGNLQHLALVRSRGITGMSRLHFISGIMAYVSSPLWFLFILIGLGMQMLAKITEPASGNFLDLQNIANSLIFTAFVLICPKILGLIQALGQKSLLKNCGGVLRLAAGIFLEQLFSVLFAPLMMLFHSSQIFDILGGRDSGWANQRRTLDSCTWKEAWRLHWPHLLLGCFFALLGAYLGPVFFVLLLPSITGLLLAIPFSKCTASAKLGRKLAAWGLFRIPEESNPAWVLLRRSRIYAGVKSGFAASPLQ